MKKVTFKTTDKITNSTEHVIALARHLQEVINEKLLKNKKYINCTVEAYEACNRSFVEVKYDTDSNINLIRKTILSKIFDMNKTWIADGRGGYGIRFSIDRDLVLAKDITFEIK